MRLTERLVYALPADAANAQVEAYRLKDDRPHRQRALEALAVFERLAAGETFDAIAGSITAAAVAPVWTMPAGQPVDVCVDQLQARRHPGRVLGAPRPQPRSDPLLLRPGRLGVGGAGPASDHRVRAVVAVL